MATASAFAWLNAACMCARGGWSCVSTPPSAPFPQLFLSTEVLGGKVRVTPPPGRTVWHGGITAKLESVIST